MSVALAVDDPYLLLGVPRDADDRLLKVAYRQRARELHPDVCPDADADGRFADVTRAYRRLADQSERRLIDADIDEWHRFVGAQPSPCTAPQDGEDVTVTLRLTATQALAGGIHEITVARLADCEPCAGSGLPQGRPVEPCQECEGSGHRVHIQRTLAGNHRSWRPCLSCQGRGREMQDRCQGCRGEGRTPESATLAVKIPSGLQDGALLVLRREGNVGRCGGERGNLNLELVVSDRLPH